MDEHLDEHLQEMNMRINLGTAFGRIAIIAGLVLPVGGLPSPADAQSKLKQRADVTPQPEGSRRARRVRVMVDLPKPPFAIDRLRWPPKTDIACPN